MKALMPLIVISAATQSAHAADIELGKQLATTVCAACHGPSGISVSDTDSRRCCLGARDHWRHAPTRNIAATFARRTGRDGQRARCRASRIAVYYVGHGEIVYQQACKLGCEGIVSKRLGSTYRSGRSTQWVKIKNPAAPAVRREAEDNWRR
jgi:hypothetical protein